MKLDIGCGPNKKEGFKGVDQYTFEGVDIVGNAATVEFWNRFEAGSIEEVYSSHFVEHLTAKERIVFFNGVFRVLPEGGKATIICPHWASCRAYGDPTHQWPPFGEFALYYLGRDWRATNAPHTDAKHWPEGYDCNFEATWGYGLNPNILSRNAEYQQYAVNFYKEAVSDIHVTLTARK